MRKFKAVIFDIDGTLTDHNSWYAFTHDIGGSKDEHASIYADFLEGIISYEVANKKVLAMWQDTGNASKTRIEEIYTQWPIRQEAYPLIEWLKSEKYLICLITGATSIYAKSVAEALGIKSYYANADFHFDRDDKLTGWHYNADQASVKLSQFEEFCKLNNLEPEDCFAVGDSSNDIKLFNATKHGILINNDHTKEDLRKSAWKIVNSLSEVKDLIY